MCERRVWVVAVLGIAGCHTLFGFSPPSVVAHDAAGETSSARHDGAGSERRRGDGPGDARDRSDRDNRAPDHGRDSTAPDAKPAPCSQWSQWTTTFCTGTCCATCGAVAMACNLMGKCTCQRAGELKPCGFCQPGGTGVQLCQQAVATGCCATCL
jgi:hypothetical protein